MLKYGKSHGVPVANGAAIESRCFFWAISVLAVTVSLGMVCSVHAQSTEVSGSSPTKILDQVQQKSQEIEQLRSALESPDSSVRVAAFDAMVNSGNPALSELAINTAFESADQTMRSLAFRGAFLSVNQFMVNISPPQTASERAVHDCVEGTHDSSMKIKTYTYSYGKFEADGGLKGQISGSIITFGGRSCTGSLKNVDGTWEFRGPVTCGGTSCEGSYRVR